MKCCYPVFKWDTIAAKLNCPILAVSVWGKEILFLMVFLYVARHWFLNRPVWIKSITYKNYDVESDFSSLSLCASLLLQVIQRMEL